MNVVGSHASESFVAQWRCYFPHTIQLENRRTLVLNQFPVGDSNGDQFSRILFSSSAMMKFHRNSEALFF